VKAAGEVVISRGILEGRNLRAQWKNQQLQEGKLRVGLEGEDAPSMSRSQWKQISPFCHLFSSVDERSSFHRGDRTIPSVGREGCGKDSIGREFEIDWSKSRRSRGEFNRSLRPNSLPGDRRRRSGFI